ncbi:TIGR03643 family protein [Pseudoalteromonas sp. SSDWG2]|uniref:TIGR03643 family protein n=1 Tax=Pseudoalteromonas sp. SSDWG2 TaxID=3139391 RepID=UPI003BAC4993
MLSTSDQSRIIEMAWEDRTPFEAIERLYGLDEKGVIAFMRKELKPSSFRLWRKRMSGRTTKHQALRSPDITRGYCKTQYKHR